MIGTSFPIVYRLLATKNADGCITLSLHEDGIEEPNADIVLLWKDENDQLWAQHGDRDYRIDNISVSNLDFCSDNVNTEVIIGNNPAWRNVNVGSPVL